MKVNQMIPTAVLMTGSETAKGGMAVRLLSSVLLLENRKLEVDLRLGKRGENCSGPWRRQ